MIFFGIFFKLNKKDYFIFFVFFFKLSPQSIIFLVLRRLYKPSIDLQIGLR